jgi:hypothetical protein
MSEHGYRGAVSLFGVLAVVATSHGSAAWAPPGGSPSSQKVPDGYFNYSAVIRAGGLGSGGLFDIVKNVKDDKGNSYYQLDFISAAHVTTGKFGYAAFQNQNGVSYYTVTAQNSTNSMVYTGGPTGKEDLSVIGVDIPMAKLPEPTVDYLNGLSSESQFLTANGLKSGDRFTAYGWGATAIGEAYYKDGDKTIGAFIIGNQPVNPVTKPVDRYILGDTLDIDKSFNLKAYTYQAYHYQFQTQVGYGITFPGDSGGVVLNGDGKWVGITTAADPPSFQPDPIIPGHMTNAILAGANGYGLLFTQADVDWIKKQAATFNAQPLTTPMVNPAPAPAAGFAFLAGALRMRRRKRRAASDDVESGQMAQ